MKKASTALFVVTLFVGVLCWVVPAFASAPSTPGFAVTVEPSDGTTDQPDLTGACRWVGFYVPHSPDNIALTCSVEAKVGFHAPVVSLYQCINEGFPQDNAQRVVDHGSTPLITLELWRIGGGSKQPEYSLRALTGSANDSGTLDAYLRQYARDAKAFGHTVWLRPLHEMNGNWDYPWSGNLNDNKPAHFVPAWRHIKNIFAEEGATNVKFVWSPNAESVPAPTSSNHNSIVNYWPGAAYVDIVAIDGFNWSDTLPGLRWRTFDDVYGSAYRQVQGFGRPIILGEVSSVEAGGDKAAWIRSAFSAIPRTYPRIVGMVWYAANTTRDWRVESSSSSLQAFRLGVSNGVYSPGFRVAVATTALSLGTNKARVARGGAFTLSGKLTPGAARDRIVVDVLRPGATRWVSIHTSLTTSRAAWSYRRSLGKRGTYLFRVRYLGDRTRAAVTSRTVKVVVR